MRGVVGALTGLVLLALMPLTAARLVDVQERWLVMLAALSSYALTGYAVVVVLLILQLRHARHRVIPVVGLLVAGALLIVHAAWIVPLFTGSTEQGNLVVMTSNLQRGGGDPATVVRTVVSEGVDVLVLEEITPAALRGMLAAGLAQRLRNRAGTAEDGVRGTMVFSSYRLSGQVPLRLGNGGYAVTLATPRPIRLLAVHTAQPVESLGQWHADLANLADRVGEEGAGTAPVLAVGDFNATFDHVMLRRVLERGLSDAAEQAGAGWQPTWPTRWRKDWLRPVVPIDHVLTGRGITGVRAHTVAVDHTDHLSLVAVLHVPTS